MESAVEAGAVPLPKKRATQKKKQQQDDSEIVPVGSAPKRRHKACEQDVNRIAALRARRTCVKTCA